jgi:hypothetical protein
LRVHGEQPFQRDKDHAENEKPRAGLQPGEEIGVKMQVLHDQKHLSRDCQARRRIETHGFTLASPKKPA